MLLHEIRTYRKRALAHVSSTLVQLQQLSADLDDLRQRVATPALAGEQTGIPLEVRSVPLTQINCLTLYLYLGPHWKHAKGDGETNGWAQACSRARGRVSPQDTLQRERPPYAVWVLSMSLRFFNSLDETVMIIIALYGFLDVFMLPRGLYPMCTVMNEMIIWLASYMHFYQISIISVLSTEAEGAKRKSTKCGMIICHAWWAHLTPVLRKAKS